EPAIAGYSVFHDFYTRHGGRHGDAQLAWHEIRAVIKGALPVATDPPHDDGVPQLLSLDDYLALPDSWGYVSRSERPRHYRLALKYQEHLSCLGMVDEQD